MSNSCTHCLTSELPLVLSLIWPLQDLLYNTFDVTHFNMLTMTPCLTYNIMKTAGLFRKGSTLASRQDSHWSKNNLIGSLASQTHIHSSGSGLREGVGLAREREWGLACETRSGDTYFA